MALTLVVITPKLRVSSWYFRRNDNSEYTVDLREGEAECELGDEGSLKSWVEPAQGTLVLSVQYGDEQKWTAIHPANQQRQRNGSAIRSFLCGLVPALGKGRWRSTASVSLMLTQLLHLHIHERHVWHASPRCWQQT